MPSADTENTEDIKKPGKAPESSGPKRATLESLRSKKRAQKELFLMLDGEEQSFLLRAISAKDYDRLLTAYPPNTEQRVAGSVYNINTFAPALMSRVIVDPELTEDQWTEMWISPDWNRGELMSFFLECVNLCNTGLSLGPTAVD